MVPKGCDRRAPRGGRHRIACASRAGRVADPQRLPHLARLTGQGSRTHEVRAGTPSTGGSEGVARYSGAKGRLNSLKSPHDV